MERVVGVGGIFFKSKNPKKLAAWYRKNLGFEITFGAMAVFESSGKGEQTVWTTFEAKTKYFAPSKASFMINYRVRSLDKMLAQLRKARASVDERVEESEFGKFGWASDPEGNRIELWEPPKKKRK
jgi:predicted enzyme related to lactoylglutathione lyase